MADERYVGGDTHHVALTIDGTEYGFMLVSPRAWREMDISDFSPRISSGGLQYRDLSLWQMWAQDGWRHGYGFPFFTDEEGYAKTGNGVDTRHKGIVMLASAITASETGVQVQKFIDFDGHTYACLLANAGVRKYDNAAWAATSETTGTINDAISTGDYLLVAPDGAQLRKANTSGTWSNAGSAVNVPTDIGHLCLHGGYAWASEHGANKLHYAGEEDLSDFEGSGDTDEIVVGPGNVPIVNLCSYAGVLYVAREDGMWVVDDTNTAYSQMDFSTLRHADNFKSMCVWKGHLYFTVRQNIYRYTGSTLLDVTPPRYEETYPYETYGNFDHLTPRGDFLYCTARNTENSYGEVILCYDGVGWHKLYDVVSTPYAINAMNLSPNNDYLWLNYTGTSNTTSYIPLQALSNLPYASFPTTGNHYLYTSKLDATFLDVIKSLKALRVRTNNCSATQTITVAYSIDDGAYAALGVVNASPYQELAFPDCVTYTTYGKTLQLRLDFATAAAAQSPILEAIGVKYLLRPNTVWGWTMTIHAADDSRDLTGRVERDFTAAEKFTALKAARDSKCPCVLEDIDGAEHSVFITSLNAQVVRKERGKNLEYSIIVSMADAS